MAAPSGLGLSKRTGEWSTLMGQNWSLSSYPVHRQLGHLGHRAIHGAESLQKKNNYLPYMQLILDRLAPPGAQSRVAHRTRRGGILPSTLPDGGPYEEGMPLKHFRCSWFSKNQNNARKK